jgi:hypothetical protein
MSRDIEGFVPTSAASRPNAWGGIDFIDVPVRLTPENGGVVIYAFESWTGSCLVWSAQFSNLTPSDVIVAAVVAALDGYEKGTQA